MDYRLLGYAGLIPFIGAAVAVVVLPDASWPANSLIFYGVAILSFLGGVHWGLVLGAGKSHGARATADWRFVFSVAPSLAAWLAFLLPQREALFYLAACFGLFWLFERMLTVLPLAYRQLRVVLTVIVAVSLTAAGLAAG